MNHNDQKRIFFGIPASPQIKPTLLPIKSTVNCNPSIIKWIPLKNIHLTLSFLGDISSKDTPNLIKSVKNNISMAQFQISISGAGVFPSSKSPKVLWLGIDRGVNELKLLHHQIEESVMIYKADYEKKPFIPHITIAKIKKVSPIIDVLPFLNSVYSPTDLEVISVSMYESKLFPEGVQYTVLKTFPLN